MGPDIIIRNEHALLCTMAFNYAFVTLWFLVYVKWRDPAIRLWATWFKLSDSQFDALNFGGMMIYKLLILVFNVAPYLALRFGG